MSYGDNHVCTDPELARRHLERVRREEAEAVHDRAERNRDYLRTRQPTPDWVTNSDPIWDNDRECTLVQAAIGAGLDKDPKFVEEFRPDLYELWCLYEDGQIHVYRERGYSTASLRVVRGSAAARAVTKKRAST